MSDKLTDRLSTEFKQVVDKVNLIYGENGNELKEALWYLRSFDSITPAEQSNPNVVAKVRAALANAEFVLRMTRGMGLHDNFPPKFWNTDEGALIAKAQYWLYRDQLVSRIDAHTMIFGQVARTQATIPSIRKQRVWLHSKCYPARHRLPKLRVVARDMLFKNEVEALREEVQAYEEAEKHHREFGGRRTKDAYEDIDE